MLKFEQAPLVERIKIDLTTEVEGELVNWLNSRENEIEKERQSFQERQLKYLHNWDDFITNTRKGPWEESSNLHLPLTAIMVKSLHARFYEIFTNDKTTILKPRETADDEYIKLIRKLRNWYMWDYLNKFTGIRGFAREVFWDTVTVGFGIGIKDWETIQRKVITLEPNEVKELTREITDLEPQVKELAAGKKELETDEEMANRVSVSPYKEVQKILKVFEGTSLRSVPWENAYFPSEIRESSDMDDPNLVTIETVMSLSDIKMKAAQGVYHKDMADEVIESQQTTYQGTRGADIKERRNTLSGIDKSDYLESSDRVVKHSFATYDIDGDGFDEEIVVTRCNNTILSVNFLDRISPMGRPVFKFDCFAKPRQSYSRGAPEYIHPIQTEIDHMHNKRQDLLTLQTTPFGVYRAGSSLKREPIKIAPGKLIPADDTSDIKLLSWGASAQAFTAEQQMLWNYAERMLSVTALSQGAMPDTVGPLRSTSGVLTMLKQMQKDFIASIDMNAIAWKRMEKMVLHDLDTRISMGVKLKVLGPMVKNPEDLVKKYGDSVATAMGINGNFDIDIDVLAASNFEEVRRNESQVLLNLLANPSIAQQSGIVGPKGIYKALADVLSDYGRDPDDYLDEPELIAKSLTLFQEIQICGQGMIPPMSLNDDHQAKAQMLMQFIQTPEFQEAIVKGLYVQDTPMWLQKAAQKHMALMQATQPKGMPNPTGDNGANMNETQSGTSPQQGGQDPNKTTSRDLKEGESKDAGQGSKAPEGEGDKEGK